VVELTRALRALPGLEELAVTTNGVSPWSKLSALVEAGMTGFNISLDTLRPERFASISRRPAKYLGTVQGNVERLVAPVSEGGAGLGGRVKLNNVIMRGVNDDELGDFVALTRDRPLDVRFIEWMPFDSNGWNGGTFVAYSEMIGAWVGRGGVVCCVLCQRGMEWDGGGQTVRSYRPLSHSLNTHAPWGTP
jgi:GTP 3',8-cyclase